MQWIQETSRCRECPSSCWTESGQAFSMQNGKIICCDTSRIAEPVLSPLHKSVSPSKSYLKFNGDARTQRTPKHFVRVGCARQATETCALGTGGRAVRYPLTRLALVRRKAVREAVGFPCSYSLISIALRPTGEVPGWPRTRFRSGCRRSACRRGKGSRSCCRRAAAVTPPRVD